MLSKKMAKVFKALGDPTRLKIIRILASNDDKTLCVADIADKLGMTRPAISQHLNVLKHIDLLEDHKEGFRVYYTIKTDVLGMYKSTIDDMYQKAFKKCKKTITCVECVLENEKDKHLKKGIKGV